MFTLFIDHPTYQIGNHLFFTQLLMAVRTHGATLYMPITMPHKLEAFLQAENVNVVSKEASTKEGEEVPNRLVFMMRKTDLSKSQARAVFIIDMKGEITEANIMALRQKNVYCLASDNFIRNGYLNIIQPESSKVAIQSSLFNNYRNDLAAYLSSDKSFLQEPTFNRIDEGAYLRNSFVTCSPQHPEPRVFLGTEEIQFETEKNNIDIAALVQQDSQNSIGSDQEELKDSYLQKMAILLERFENLIEKGNENDPLAFIRKE